MIADWSFSFLFSHQIICTQVSLDALLCNKDKYTYVHMTALLCSRESYKSPQCALSVITIDYRLYGNSCTWYTRMYGYIGQTSVLWSWRQIITVCLIERFIPLNVSKLREGFQNKNRQIIHILWISVLPPLPLSTSAEVNNIHTKEFFLSTFADPPPSALIHFYRY